jgi:hypothetical protein
MGKDKRTVLVCPCGGARLEGSENSLSALIPFTNCRKCGKSASEFKEEKSDE